MNALATLPIGAGHTLPARLILAVLDPESGPVKRFVQQTRQKAQFFDLTQGRRARSLVITVLGEAYLTSLLPETLAQRLLRRDLLTEGEA